LENRTHSEGLKQSQPMRTGHAVVQHHNAATHLRCTIHSSDTLSLPPEQHLSPDQGTIDVYKAIHSRKLGTMLFQRTVHPSFGSIPLLMVIWSYPGQSYNLATSILCGRSSRLVQSTTAHSFCAYIINLQKHVQDTYFLTVLRHWL